MNVNETEARRLAMLQVCDSVFPVGAFALSNGMETFVQRDFLRRGADFEQYMKNYLEVAPYKEIGQMVLAGKAASDARLSRKGLAARLTDLDELASALQSAREIREGSERMCTRLIKLAAQMDAGRTQSSDGHRDRAAHGVAGAQTSTAQADASQTAQRDDAARKTTTATTSTAPTVQRDVPDRESAFTETANRPQHHPREAATRTRAAQTAQADDEREDSVIAVHEHGTERHRLDGAAAGLYGSPTLELYAQLVRDGRCRGVHAIAMGLYAADHATDIRDAAVMYGYSLLSALTMCAAKAIPLSQYAGQVALHDSFPRLVRAVDIAMTLHAEDLGISGAFLDIAAMQHETLYSRLYMS